MDLSDYSVAEVLALHAGTLAELRKRGIVRTGNAPAGDLAELLVARATGGQLADNSQRSWDVYVADGAVRLQVKARLVDDMDAPSKRQLSPFRTWDFDAAVLVPSPASTAPAAPPPCAAPAPGARGSRAGAATGSRPTDGAARGAGGRRRA